jgi:hypothetical protein
VTGPHPKRIDETQARIAGTPAVARLALRTDGSSGRTVDELLRFSSVTADPNADLLEFSVEDPTAADAIRLATAYATAFTRFTRALDTSAIARARQGAQERIRRLERTRHREPSPRSPWQRARCGCSRGQYSG